MSKNTRRGPADVDSVMQFLWSKRDSLDIDDLKWLSGASDTASYWAANLARSVEGVACLIANDGRIEDIQAGNFQGADDVPGLLFTIANQVAAIGQLARIGFDAYDEMHTREVSHG